jgi:hypothetical protein
MGKVRVGMTESELLRLMRPVTLDWGCVHFGGFGKRRYYFQVSPSSQIWYFHDGYPDFKLVYIGELEPKTQWKHYEGDRMTVEGMLW